MTTAPIEKTTRPTVVTVAYWFQVALVGALLLIIGVSIADAIHYNGLIDEAARGGGVEAFDVSSERDSNVAFTLFVGLPLLVLAVWLGVTAVFVGRGSNVARILTWIGLGTPVVLFLLSCLFGGLVGAFGFFAFTQIDDADFDDPGFDEGSIEFSDGTGSDFYDRLYNLDSGGWSVAFDAVLAVAVTSAVLLAIATVVLLITGQADGFFRPNRRPKQGQLPFPYAGQGLLHPVGAQPFPPPAAMTPSALHPTGFPYPAPPPQHPWTPPTGHHPGPPTAFPPAPPAGYVPGPPPAFPPAPSAGYVPGPPPAFPPALSAGYVPGPPSDFPPPAGYEPGTPPAPPAAGTPGPPPQQTEPPTAPPGQPTQDQGPADHPAQDQARPEQTPPGE